MVEARNRLPCGLALCVSKRYLPSMLARLLAALLCIVLLSAATPLDHAGRIASLIDRSKLSTLGTRAANPPLSCAAPMQATSCPLTTSSPAL